MGRPPLRGYAAGQVRPVAAYYDEQLWEYILRYEDVRQSPTPEQDILDFFESTYEVAARLAAWDHDRLEFTPPRRTPRRKERT